MRPLAFGEVLDLGFGVFRRDFRLYVPLALVGLVPTMVATAIPTAADIDPETMLADPVAGLPFAGLLVVGGVLSLLTWAALATAIDARMDGRGALIGASYAKALSSLPRLLGAALLAALLLIAALVLVALPATLLAVAPASSSFAGAIVASLVMLAGVALVGGWWAAHTFMLVPAVALEGRGPIDGLRRSFGLVRGSRVRAFSVFVVVWFMAALPTLAAYLVAGSAGALLDSNPAETLGPLRYWLAEIFALAFRSVTTPLWMACAMVLFTDLKARREGADLESLARAMAD